MIDYISGSITQMTPAFITIETGGIGYFVNISLSTFTRLEGKKNYKILIHEVIREDSHQFFLALPMRKERGIFRLLISVTGVGANTARMMLSSLSPVEIEKAIIGNDVNSLQGVKGIGLKLHKGL
jgi:holliday junction DNA helicase RuvA